MSIGLIGKKLGMTRVYDDKGRITPVTVIHVAPNAVVQRKTVEKDGYSALQLAAFDQADHRMTKPVVGHLKKNGVGSKRKLQEFRCKSDEFVTGAPAEVTVNQFQVGQWVDVIGQSKGKGFQGVMKKHNFHGQGAAHGSKTHRRNGAIGNRSTPGRVWKNMGMPGHMGDERVTAQNLKVVQVREEDNALLVSGPVPGAAGGYVFVRAAKKKPLPSAAKK
ncbi:50S ribosomal protein L3 [Verrucomicrobia bacterium SCGC AG-212-E04]|nr:50S ribosomal protein L3 [Verrucomicrobia bacterium SCGC AG-212-E04]